MSALTLISPDPTTTDAEAWRVDARCADAAGSLTELFFSEDLADIARAKAFCAGCPVRGECLAGALERREPWGVWGGESIVNGRVTVRRPRGRPPKVARLEPVAGWEIPVADIA